MTLIQTTRTFVCRYADMRSRIIETAGRAEIVSASHAFLDLPPDGSGVSYSYVSVLLVMRGTTDVIEAMDREAGS